MNENGKGPLGYNRRDFLKSSSFASLMSLMGGVELFTQTTSSATEESKPAGAKLKIGVIGLGGWGREILNELGRLEQAEVAAICDTYGAFLRRSGKLAPHAKQVADCQAILEDKDIRAVVVATPTHKHKDIVLAALKAGKHVYCEAPLAGTIEDAREIARAARDAKKQIFQAGLQMRSHPQRHFLRPYIRSGALVKSVLARAQWHRKQSWRTASSDAEHEKALNWRLSKATSTGLIGEIGIHQIDQASWFLGAHPMSITGFSSLVRWGDDGRDVPDTVQAVFEFPGGVRFIYDCTLANSFDADYELYYGADAAVMLREDKAWMFKEVDSPLGGWEVYAKKETFYHETGIVLALGGSKQANLESKGGAAADIPTPLHYALDAFVRNSSDVSTAVEDFIANYGADDPGALLDHLSKAVTKRAAAGYLEGFQAAVTVIKANEAVNSGQRVTFTPDMFELG